MPGRVGAIAIVERRTATERINRLARFVRRAHRLRDIGLIAGDSDRAIVVS